MQSTHEVQKARTRWAIALLLSVATGASAFSDEKKTGYSPAMNYKLHCEGCHKDDGSGQPGFVPTFQGAVSKYLSVPEGRAYLVRVPGTAQSLLNDRDTADVLNWIVRTFDSQHLPAKFTPYSAREVGRLRRDPISESNLERTRILALLDADKVTRKGDRQASSPAAGPPVDSSSASRAAATSVPPGFAICTGCHSVSNDGAHSIGPNLRGVVGRRAASAPDFNFSKAIRNSGIVWSKQELDRFLSNAAARVPGNLMTFNSVGNADERRAIIEYLETLQ